MTARKGRAERAGMGGLQPLDAGLNSECRAFAEELRGLFLELDVTVRRYATRCFINPGTLSRYLAGSRIPHWKFVADLLGHVAVDCGIHVDLTEQKRIKELHLAALRTNASISQAVQQLEGQLKAADEEARKTTAKEEQLDHAVGDARHLIADLDDRLKKLETGLESQFFLHPEPAADHAAILEERNTLAAGLARMAAELEETRRRAVLAEARCELLERQLVLVEQQQGTVLPAPELVSLVDPLDAPALVAGIHPKILLVDDQGANLLALEAVLGVHGYDMVSVSSGPDALRALLEADDFAVILLDVQMPVMDGYETAAHIKRRARTRDIPIIFLTAIGNDPEYSMRGYAAGAVDFIVKPFDPWALRAKVAVFVEFYLQRRLPTAQR
ncbi:response regulator [Kitasatospora griseola]|uniref:response regulator n=1 Tax=Kitasatospora griseola TaxID=2064 RepID=UPI003830B3D7